MSRKTVVGMPGMTTPSAPRPTAITPTEASSQRRGCAPSAGRSSTSGISIVMLILPERLGVPELIASAASSTPAWALGAVRSTTPCGAAPVPCLIPVALVLVPRVSTAVAVRRRRPPAGTLAPIRARLQGRADRLVLHQTGTGVNLSVRRGTQAKRAADVPAARERRSWVPPGRRRVTPGSQASGSQSSPGWGTRSPTAPSARPAMWPSSRRTDRSRWTGSARRGNPHRLVR